jgi:hypothetical protein
MKRASLFAPPGSEPEIEIPPPPVPEVPAEKPKSQRASTRIGKRLVTAYVEPEALKQLQLLSVTEERTMQDLLTEGINAVFAARNLTRMA